MRLIHYNFENELLTDWIHELKHKKGDYLEPLICQQTIKLIKLACVTFNQDIHVFIMSVDMLEDYIRIKNLMNEGICENTLVISAIVFMCSKYMGEQDLKVQYVEKFLTKITGKEYSKSAVRLTEMDILKTLDNKLPVTTKVDDLNAVVTKYEREYMIKVDIRLVCLDILEALYFTRDNWFFELKTTYLQTEEALNVFKSLMSSRLFLPIGILLYALLHTNYQQVCIERIMEELTIGMHIHVDHVNLLVSKIHEMVRLGED